MLDFSKVFIIAEAGSNWKAGTYKKDLERAKKLITEASLAGADAVKFQTFRSEYVYVQNAGSSNYLKKSGIRKNINNIFKRLEMPYEMLSELSEFCREKNIEFMSSVFSVTDAMEINKYVKIHKVASYEINHVRLLEYLAKTKKPIIISTGASNLSEIDYTVKLLKKVDVKDFGLLQCTAKYPAPLDTLNLLTIPEMKKRYSVPIGFSDHSIEPIIGPLVSVALGAKIIEKHFTLNRNLSGPDHKFSLVPSELKIMIDNIRLAEKTLGDGKKRVLKEENELRDFAVRKVQTTKDIKKGDILFEGENIDLLRPGERKRGEDARFFLKIINKKSNKNIKAGDGVRLKDII